MNRVALAGLVYALAAGLLVVGAPDGTFTDARGHLRPFGTGPGQSPVALSAALPALGVMTYSAIALLDLINV